MVFHSHSVCVSLHLIFICIRIYAFNYICLIIWERPCMWLCGHQRTTCGSRFSSFITKLGCSVWQQVPEPTESSHTRFIYLLLIHSLTHLTHLFECVAQAVCSPGLLWILETSASASVSKSYWCAPPRPARIYFGKCVSIDLKVCLLDHQAIPVPITE